MGVFIRNGAVRAFVEAGIFIFKLKEKFKLGGGGLQITPVVFLSRNLTIRLLPELFPTPLCWS